MAFGAPSFPPPPSHWLRLVSQGPPAEVVNFEIFEKLQFQTEINCNLAMTANVLLIRIKD